MYLAEVKHSAPSMGLLRLLHDLTGDGLLSIKECLRGDGVTLKLDYPDDWEKLPEFVDSLDDLLADGASCRFRQVWDNGDSRPISLQYLHNLVERDQEIDTEQDEYLERVLTAEAENDDKPAHD